MQNATVFIERYDPAQAKCVEYAYSLPLVDEATVLQALLYIYENHDSTLAFRYGCRCAKCGECAVDVNGHPRLACITKATLNMRVSPLKNLPLVRDLIVDRAPLDCALEAQRLYVSPIVTEVLGSMQIPEVYRRLAGCLECYGCVSSCPQFDWRNKEFGGPYVFVRLAQLHLDPRDKEDRRAQAALLGVHRCLNCRECRCVKGIAIRRDAIGTLLAERRGEG
ncbi:MAG: 4Fe-4S dicluster domain-containing protein [Candidatus Lindowbacteria bacterium]|nr:4Fe-4S dicluster domain-containing protein [Candidatus Lindowbacteria bacterium]